MFGVKKGKTPPNSIDSLIGAGTRIDGNVTFSGGLRVDGEVHGNISSESGEQGTVVISEKAAARVTGDVEYHQIEMQQGAVIQGRLVHQTSVKAVELKLATSN